MLGSMSTYRELEYLFLPHPFYEALVRLVSRVTRLTDHVRDPTFYSDTPRKDDPVTITTSLVSVFLSK